MGMCAIAAIAQPLGALVGWATMHSGITHMFNGAMYSTVAGFLLFVALIELLPYGFPSGFSGARGGGGVTAQQRRIPPA
jgi:zinc transporter ZupT